MNLKFLFATVVLLFPTVYGCIEFEASMPWQNHNGQLHSILPDDGQVPCTANIDTLRNAPDLYFYTCLDQFLASFNEGTGEARYENPSGSFTFSAHVMEGVWRACEYGCSDSQCLQRPAVSASQRRSLLENVVGSSPSRSPSRSPSSSPCPVKTSGKDKGRCGWVPPADHRSSFAILYGCLGTLFACSWSILQLNLPGPDESTLRRFFRKAKWMVLALAFPDVIGAISLVEFSLAWRLHKGIKGPDGKPWSLTHCFFANMGGFVLHSHGAEQLPLNGEALQLLINENKIEVPTVTKDQILDRSKIDYIGKTVAFLQVLWFAVQVIGRLFKGYFVTDLEVLTCLAVLLGLITYGFEWWKPKDVTFPIDVYCGSELGKDLEDQIAEIYNQKYGPQSFIPDKGFERIKSTKRIPFGDVANPLVDNILNRGWFAACYSICCLSGFYNGLNFGLGFRSESFPYIALYEAWRASFIVTFIISVGGPLFLASQVLLKSNKFFGKWKKSLWRITVTVYCCARLLPFVLALVCFKSQPPSAYAELHWTSFFPHVS